tara:strand:- start:1619 stop:1759 length:141 start_codon:yes stop_codon:yes gene_type:complete
MEKKRRFEVSSTIEDADWMDDLDENIRELEKLLILSDKKDLSDSNY